MHFMECPRICHVSHTSSSENSRELGDPPSTVQDFYLWHDFYHNHLPSPPCPCPRSSQHLANLAPVALGKRLERNNSTVSGLRLGCLDPNFNHRHDIGRLLGICDGDQGDQEIQDNSRIKTARTARTKASTKKLNNKTSHPLPIFESAPAPF